MKKPLMKLKMVLSKLLKYKSSHQEDLIIGNKESPRRTRSYFRQEESMLGLLSVIEPTIVDEALSDDGWILDM